MTLFPGHLLIQPYGCIIFCLLNWSLPTARNEPISSIFYLWVLHLHDRGEGRDISLNTEYLADPISCAVLPMAGTESPWWWPPPTPPRWSLPWRQPRQRRQEISEKENKVFEKKRMIYIIPAVLSSSLSPHQAPSVISHTLPHLQVASLQSPSILFQTIWSARGTLVARGWLYLILAEPTLG